MPPKLASAHRKVKSKLKTTVKENSSTIKSSLSGSGLAECKKQKPKPDIVDQLENDWRYMAVTAFLVKYADSRLTVCFVVVACSDATLMLRALLLPHRLWFNVAALVSQSSPILALQHLVIPSFGESKDNVRTGNAYIIIGGSTDGSVTFWDLTETVEDFMQRTLELRTEILIDYQRRPQTGRGSQGGRWWRSMMNQSPQKNVSVSLMRSEAGNNGDGQCTEEVSVDAPSSRGSDSDNCQTNCSQTSSKLSSPEICEMWPLHVLNSVHHSGVNCLHVSERKDCLQSKSEMSYCILSGGDDQAVHYIAFDLTRKIMHPDSCNSKHTGITSDLPDWALGGESGSVFTEKCSSQSLQSKYQLRVLYRDRVDSAHSSAVKGIWTDDIWAFSTGLDQRIRCWNIGPRGKLAECAHLVVSVPEPEALDAISCGRERYQIAASGRGMQMAEFHASVDED